MLLSVAGARVRKNSHSNGKEPAQASKVMRANYYYQVYWKDGMQYLFAMNKRSVKVLHLVIQLEQSSYIRTLEPPKKECDAML